MKILLNVCLFACLVTPGSSLQCETCEALGGTCSGPLQTCPANGNKCGILLTETTLGIKIQAIKKGCIPPENCGQDTGVINMGKAGMMVSHTFCCVGDECKKNNPILPSIDMNPNGKICPACYALQSGVCEDEIVQCTGNQEHCFSVSGNTELGGTSVKTTMKGCVSRHFCAELQNESNEFSGIRTVISSTCKPAQSRAMMHVSWIARIVSGKCGFFIQAFTGLLLMFLFL